MYTLLSLILNFNALQLSSIFDLHSIHPGIISVVKHEVVGVVGSSVSIPCNCTPSYSHTQDSPVLILWYKNKAKLPIYRSVLCLHVSYSFFTKLISSLHQKHSNITLKKVF